MLSESKGVVPGFAPVVRRGGTEQGAVRRTGRAPGKAVIMIHSERLAIVHAGIRAGMSVREARNYADSLAPDTRLTAAQAAARELGLTAEDVDFALAGSTSGEHDAEKGEQECR